MCENIAASESDAPSESKSHLPSNLGFDFFSLAESKASRVKRLTKQLNALLPES